MGYESHSEAEIRDHLRRKGIAKVDLPAALDKLKQRDYLRPVGNSSAWARPREPNRAGRRPYGY